MTDRQIVDGDVTFAMIRAAQAVEIIKTLHPDHPVAIERDRIATAAMKLWSLRESEAAQEQLVKLQTELARSEAEVQRDGKAITKTAQVVQRAVDGAIAVLDAYIAQEKANAGRAGIDDGGDA